MRGATYYKTSQEWLDNSILLVEARPTTTRITTKYTIKRPREATDATTPLPAKGPRGRLVLKTFDPVSGATLKYKTTKAAEVNRLVQVMGRLGRGMAGVEGMREAIGEQQQQQQPPERAEEAVVPEKEEGAGKGTQGGGAGAGAGGKKKKKGRK